MEQLQLQVESRLFEQDEKGLAEMIELLGIEDDLAGKSKMQRIKIITKTIDSKMAGEEKEARTCLEQLLAFVTGNVPPLKEVEQKPAASRVKTEKQSSGRGPKQEKGVEDILSQLAKTKLSSSLLRREFKISGQIATRANRETYFCFLNAPNRLRAKT